MRAAGNTGGEREGRRRKDKKIENEKGEVKWLGGINMIKEGTKENSMRT